MCGCVNCEAYFLCKILGCKNLLLVEGKKRKEKGKRENVRPFWLHIGPQLVSLSV